jgi:hypothetical protein
MLFPNLVWAISQLGTRYRFASGLGVSESWLSHRLTGRLKFSTEDRERIANTLGYPCDWLFAKPSPPVRPQTTEPVCMEA